MLEQIPGDIFLHRQISTDLPKASADTSPQRPNVRHVRHSINFIKPSPQYKPSSNGILPVPGSYCVVNIQAAHVEARGLYVLV